MNTKEPQYNSVAAHYDLAWGNNRGETDFAAYISMGEKTNGPILEMGAGTGRVCIELAARGRNVTGLEISPRMAAIAEAKADLRLLGSRRGLLEIVIGDMCTFDTTIRFDLVILPFSSLWECGSKQCVQEALGNAYRLLSSSGCLLFDCSYYGPGGKQRPALGIHSERRLSLKTSGVLILREGDWHDTSSGVIKKWLYTDFEDDQGNVVERRTNLIQIIYLAPEELRTALSLAGFQPDKCELFGSFDLQTPIDDLSFRNPNHENYRKARQVWKCKKGHL